MTVILSIVAFLVILTLLVVVHELGHFWAAKKAGVKVQEFGFGFPPRIWGKKKGETTYSINWIPLGGFVRLFGEDAREAKALTSDRSFINKTPWTRTKIIVGGVLMNFLLAYVLLVIGFTFGIQPLLLNQDDLFDGIAQGVVEVQPGIHVKTVEEGSSADLAGVLPGDKVLRVDGFDVAQLGVINFLEKAEAEKDVAIDVVHSDGSREKLVLVLPEDGDDFGIDLNTGTTLPRPVVASIEENSPFANAGLKEGDNILLINQQSVYTPTEVVTHLSSNTSFVLTFARGQEIFNAEVVVPREPRVEIVSVASGSSAEKVGIVDGDKIFMIGGVAPSSARHAEQLIGATNGKPTEYRLLRGDKELTIVAGTDEHNRLGVTIDTLFVPFGGGVVLKQGGMVTSLSNINTVRLPFFQALGKAGSETWRLTRLTVGAFGGMLKKLVDTGEVPQDIGGPVQIAFYTHTFVQEGFFALLRFAAILSISLGVINLVPFPGLDGGRFLFVAIEVVTGRRINSKLESMVHAIGFVILIGLILLITYSDFAKILG